MQVVNYHMDTEVLNVQGKLSERLVQWLTDLQSVAKEQEQDIPTDWEFADYTLYLKPHGSGRQWKWILYCGDNYLHIDLGTSKLNGNCAKVRLSSLLLHEYGEGAALSAVYSFLVTLFGEENFVLQVGEVHQCVDIAGWELSVTDIQKFVTRGRSKTVRMEQEGEDDSRTPQLTFTGRKLTQIDFSKTAPHSCCIYDKTKEVKVHHKEWFYEVWIEHGWDGNTPVTRIEFRYDRECLRDMNIECPYDLLTRLPELWAYSTQKWLRHTTPDGKNQTRWEVSMVWLMVQAASNDEEATPAARKKKVENDAKRAMAGFVGFAVGWATRARVALSDIQEDGAGFLEWAFNPMKKYLKDKKQATFTELMQHKAKQLGVQLVA